MENEKNDENEKNVGNENDVENVKAGENVNGVENVKTGENVNNVENGNDVGDGSNAGEANNSENGNDGENGKKFPTARSVIEFLAEKYPGCFVLTGPCKPLKIGLLNELAELLPAEVPELSKTRLRHALRFYTTRWKYLQSFRPGAKRVGLDGAEGDEVTASEVEYAAKTLTESKAAFKKLRSEKNPAAGAAPAADNAAGAEKPAAAPEKKAAPGEGRPPFKRRPFKPGAKNAPRQGRPAPRREQQRPPRETQSRVHGIGAEEFVKIDVSEIGVGSKVHVLCGGTTAVEATVIEMNRDTIGVELVTGMVVRVSPDRIGR